MLWVTKRTIDSEPVSFKEGFTPKSCLQGDLEEVSDQPPPPNRKVWEALGQGEPLPLLRVCPGKLGSLLHFLPLPGTRQRKELVGCCFSAIPFPLSPSLLFFFLLLHMEINIIFKKSIKKVLSAKKKKVCVQPFTPSPIPSFPLYWLPLMGMLAYAPSSTCTEYLCREVISYRILGDLYMFFPQYTPKPR